MNLLVGVLTPLPYSGAMALLHVQVELWLHTGSVYFICQLGFILVQTGHHHSMSLLKKRCDSPMCFSECIRCSLVILIWRFIYIVRRTSRCPPSHTTHSVGSTGLALWVYAVCGVWGGWVGSFALVAVFFASFALRLPIYQMLRYFNVSCDMSFSWL